MQSSKHMHTHIHVLTGLKIIAMSKDNPLGKWKRKHSECDQSAELSPLGRCLLELFASGTSARDLAPVGKCLAAFSMVFNCKHTVYLFPAYTLFV